MNIVSKKQEDPPTSNRFLFNVNAEDSVKRSTTLLESILGKTLNRLKTNSHFPKKANENGAHSLNLPANHKQSDVGMSFQTIRVNPKQGVPSKDRTPSFEPNMQSNTDRPALHKDSPRRTAAMKTESFNQSYSKNGGKNDKVSEVFDLRVTKVPQADDDSISRDGSDALGTLSKTLKFKPIVDDTQGMKKSADTSDTFKNMDYRRSLTENQPAKSPRQANNRVMNIHKGRTHQGEFSLVAGQNQDFDSEKGRGLLQAPHNGSYGDLIPRDEAQRDSAQRSDLSMSQISKISQTKYNPTEKTALPDKDPNKDSVDFHTASLVGLPSSESRTRVASTSVSSSLKPDYEPLPRIPTKNKTANPKLDSIEEKPEPVVSPTSNRAVPAQPNTGAGLQQARESKIHISDCKPQDDLSLKMANSEAENGASPLKQHSSMSSQGRRDLAISGKKGILVNKERMNAMSELISLPDMTNPPRSAQNANQQSPAKKNSDERVRFSDKPTVWLVQSYKSHLKGVEDTSCCENCNLI